MPGAVNLMNVAVGATVKLVDGRVLQVVENPRDGAWVICATPEALEDRDAVFVAEIADVEG